MLAAGRLVVAALDRVGLAQLHDGVAALRLEGVVHRANVIAGVHRACLGPEAPRVQYVKQSGRMRLLGIASRLDLPGQRQSSGGTHRRMQLEAVADRLSCT